LLTGKPGGPDTAQKRQIDITIVVYLETPANAIDRIGRQVKDGYLLLVHAPAGNLYGQEIIHFYNNRDALYRFQAIHAFLKIKEIGVDLFRRTATGQDRQKQQAPRPVKQAGNYLCVSHNKF